MGILKRKKTKKNILKAWNYINPISINYCIYVVTENSLGKDLFSRSQTIGLRLGYPWNNRHAVYSKISLTLLCTHK